jgi:hypothetical protein
MKKYNTEVIIKSSDKILMIYDLNLNKIIG